MSLTGSFSFNVVWRELWWCAKSAKRLSPLPTVHKGSTNMFKQQVSDVLLRLNYNSIRSILFWRYAQQYQPTLIRYSRLLYMSHSSAQKIQRTKNFNVIFWIIYQPRKCRNQLYVWDILTTKKDFIFVLEMLQHMKMRAAMLSQEVMIFFFFRVLIVMQIVCFRLLRQKIIR